MTAIRHVLRLALFAAFCVGIHAAPAAAQATRTWVSGVGDDANPCSRTAPCKTFAGAISKTAAGGEINCLDPGGFGAVTITKAISILCDYTEGGILSAGTSGVVVNAAATDQILLSGLDIDGAGTGTFGVRVLAGQLHIRNCVIQRVSSTNGVGISLESTAATSIVVSRCAILKNKTGISVSGANGNLVAVDDSFIGANDRGLLTTAQTKIVSFGNNRVLNTVDGTFNITIPLK